MNNKTKRMLRKFQLESVSSPKCSLQKTVTNFLTSVLSPRNFIGGSKLSPPLSPIGVFIDTNFDNSRSTFNINLTHKNKKNNIGNYYIESHIAKINSKQKILSPKNSHRSHTRASTQQLEQSDFSLSSNIFDEKTKASLTNNTNLYTNTNMDMNISLNKNKERKKSRNNNNNSLSKYKKCLKKSKTISKKIINNINEMTRKFNKENPFYEEKKRHSLLYQLNNGKNNYILIRNPTNINKSKVKSNYYQMVSPVNQIFFKYLLKETLENKENNKNKINYNITEILTDSNYNKKTKLNSRNNLNKIIKKNEKTLNKYVQSFRNIPTSHITKFDRNDFFTRNLGNNGNMTMKIRRKFI